MLKFPSIRYWFYYQVFINAHSDLCKVRCLGTQPRFPSYMRWQIKHTNRFFVQTHWYHSLCIYDCLITNMLLDWKWQFLCCCIAGILLLNLVCRDKELKQSVIKKFFTLFEVIFSISIPASVNEVLVCLAQNSPSINDCFSSTTNEKPDKTVDNELKKVTICDRKCESLVSDLCQRLISESKQTYVRQEILGHLGHVTIHQLKNNSIL